MSSTLKIYSDKVESVQGRMMQVLGESGNHITWISDEDIKDISPGEENTCKEWENTCTSEWENIVSVLIFLNM